MKRSWTSDQKRCVAAAQFWRCGICSMLLNSAYEIDHVIALENGGVDDIVTNSMALCSNCHALKTQNERIERIKLARAKLADHTPIVKVVLPPKRAEDVILDEENPFARFCFLKPHRQLSR